MHKQITVVFYTGVPKVTVNKNLKKKKKDDDFLRSTKRTWLSKAIIKRGFTFLAEKFLRPPQANTSASAEKMSFDILQMQSI